MTYTEAYRHYRAALRRDPATPAPRLRTDTITRIHTWKAEMRGYDKARFDLGLVTAKQLLEQNAAVDVNQRARVVRHAQYA